jgi:hypothetical protein
MALILLMLVMVMNLDYLILTMYSFHSVLNYHQFKQDNIPDITEYLHVN